MSSVSDTMLFFFVFYILRTTISDNCTLEYYPYLVNIKHQFLKSAPCRGVLIHPYFALTVAPCFSKSRKKPYKIMVEYMLLYPDYLERITVSRVIISEFYDPKTLVYAVALLYLTESVEIVSDFARLASKQATLKAFSMEEDQLDTSRIFSWPQGKSKKESEAFNVECVDTVFVEEKECKDKLGITVNTTLQFCMEPEFFDDKIPCLPQNLGAPYMYRDVVVGFMVYEGNCKAAEDGKAVFVRVDSEIGLIQKTMASLGYSLVQEEENGLRVFKERGTANCASFCTLVFVVFMLFCF